MARKKQFPFTNEQIQLLRERYGIPDWRDKKAYDYIGSLTLNQLHWEFYRRESWYRNAWEKGEQWTPEQKILQQIGHFGVDELIPPYTRGMDVPKDLAVFDNVSRGHPIHKHMKPERWAYWPSDEMEDGEREDLYRQYGKELVELYEEHCLVLCFNPFYPIKPQLANAAQHLKEASRFAKEKMPGAIGRVNKPSVMQAKLLRILDAHQEDATYAEIGKVVLYYKNDDSAASEAKKRHDMALNYRKSL